MSIQKQYLAVGLLLSSAAFGWGQDADKAATLKAEARLVNLPVVVRDKKNALVRTLTKPDFALQVDGKTQPIRYFDKDDDVPLTLGLLVDTSMSQRNALDEERTASQGFLDGLLADRPSAASLATAPDKVPAEKPFPDRAFVIQFSNQTELLQDLTDSKPKLRAALKEVDTPKFKDDGGQGNGGGDREGRREQLRGMLGTTLYDAVFLSSDEVLGKQHGRKAIIILSDGDDHGSKKSLTSAIESAQRADTIIYAIYFEGQGFGGGGGRGPFGGGGGFPGGGRRGGGGGQGGQGGGQGRGGAANAVDGKKVLERMADETGGRMFEVKGKETVATIYAQIADELRSQYRLGYTPDAANSAEGYHQVTVTVPGQKNDRVQTRDGYYTGAK